MKKSTLILLFLGLFLIASCEPGLNDPVSEDKDDVEPVDDTASFRSITKQQCVEANGYWNECGSPCAGTGAELCIQVCQVQCECGGIAGFSCPKDFKCRLSGKIADEMGVCVAE